MQAKKKPERMCIGCREQKGKNELCRVVRDKDGNISFDSTGKKPGRGAYVCRNVACLEKAIKTKAFERAFSVSLSKETAEMLKESLLNG